MATLLDLSLFGLVSNIFTFILVWIVIYGILEYRKIFGEDRKGLHGLIAISVAALVLASQFALSFVNFVTPWFLILALIVFFVIFVFKVFGVEDSAIVSAGKKAHMWVIVFAIIILLFGFGTIFGQSALDQGQGTSNDSSSVTNDDSGTAGEESTDTGSFTQNMYNTLFHPKVLGFVLMMFIGVLVLIFLTSR